jgi:cysteine desulfurase
MKRPIYMDCHSTTPLDPRVWEAMTPVFLNHFGNPSQHLHQYSWEASALIEKAKRDLASCIGSDPEISDREIIFTSGATEANHLAILGLAPTLKSSGRIRILSLKIEHASVLGPLQMLSEQGFQIQWIPLLADGRINLTSLKLLIEDTSLPPVGLISVALANHEVGTIQDLTSIGNLYKKGDRIFLHTDAVQAIGRIPVDVKKMNIDLMTLSAHKAHGPKGIGAVYASRKNPRIELKPIQRGGTQEHHVRPGTPNVPLIVGMANAIQFATDEMDTHQPQVQFLRDRLWQGLQKNISGIIRNGSTTEALPNNLNVSIPGVDGTGLLGAIKNTAVSNASACLNGIQDYSQVLTELGVSKSLAKASIRFGLSRLNTIEEVNAVIEEVSSVVAQLRKLEQNFIKGKEHDSINR